MLKVAVIGVMAVFLAVIVSKEKMEFGLFIALAACMIVLFLALDQASSVIAAIRELESFLGDSRLYVVILLKMVGITYVAEFASNLCKDAGYGSVAAQIEFYGKLMLLAVSIPILKTLIETIEKI